jgi:hypothetical protein|tara:strand:- start:5262 stop:5609 length:348 start_codon:yes stop_codon:yes gene_type:complete
MARSSATRGAIVRDTSCLGASVGGAARHPSQRHRSNASRQAEDSAAANVITNEYRFEIIHQRIAGLRRQTLEPAEKLTTLEGSATIGDLVGSRMELFRSVMGSAPQEEDTEWPSN